ncbi:hypothetical protein SAMN05216276_10503 [Streptosporangium subroseum]|uniref:Uncharacterized protein n=1 Tax=Streptosporangium subroseum TaxID=106412 RepID=A0A239N3F3_9ACTN|nr:hypothetical protein [Streptosporangium subroseum]SNT48709.1 hypothetical protein SAMN05216276_10503 [Streptosporangium subroseum]
MPKKRSYSQRLGTAGENAFRIFCQQNLIVPNKLEEDFGIDFLCQVDNATNYRETGIIGGSIIGACVRAVDNPDGRIKLSRADAEALLLAQFPMLVIMVKLDGISNADVYYRFVDQEFAIQLSELLASEKTSTSFTSDRFKTAQSFKNDLGAAIAPGYVERIKAIVAERSVSSLLGDAQIEVRRTPERQTTLVTAIDLYAYFEQGTKEERRALYLATFGAPDFRTERISKLAVKAKLLGSLSQLPRPYVLRGFTVDEPIIVRVEGPAGASSCEFLRTSNAHHFGLVHQAGFSLTISRRKKSKGVWVHKMDVLVDPDAACYLEDWPELAEFLSKCMPGARISFGEPAEFEIEVDYFRDIGKCVDFARALNLAGTLDGWDEGPIPLQEFDAKESRNTAFWLASIGQNQSALQGFGLQWVTVDVTKLATKRAIIWTPVVSNTAKHSIISWVESQGEIYMHVGDACGFKLTNYLSCELEVVEKIRKSSKWPEIFISRGFPVAAIESEKAVRMNVDYPHLEDIHVIWKAYEPME